MSGGLTSSRTLAPTVLDIAGGSRIADVSISGSAAVSANMAANNFDGILVDILADIKCYIRVAVDASGVTALNGYPVPANTLIPLWVPKGMEIGVVSSGASGTLEIHESRSL